MFDPTNIFSPTNLLRRFSELSPEEQEAALAMPPIDIGRECQRQFVEEAVRRGKTLAQTLEAWEAAWNRAPLPHGR
jgi:hypothetical protein